MNYIISCLTTNYARFSGRARRKEFWMYQLFNIPFFIIIFILSKTITDPTLSFILTIIPLAFILPFLSVTVRRLHDINKDGFWVIITVPIYLNELLRIMHWPGSSVMSIISGLGSIILIIMMCKTGTVGENKYGPDPKELDTEE
ncbi:MAG: DUF805 domain-containing protein [Paludibacteraceae bacterium]|nr:DUF805 domain-containing protein [Paludibacteraceae bacterium]